MVFHLEKNQHKTAGAAGVIGNIMEWYDFALYGYMASILSVLFFPSENEIASLLATYGVFAAGFIMRPFGSLLFTGRCSIFPLYFYRTGSRICHPDFRAMRSGTSHACRAFPHQGSTFRIFSCL